jgi:hypothetical protein
VLKLENEAEEIKKLRNQYKKDKNVKKLKKANKSIAICISNFPGKFSLCSFLV